MRNPWPTFLVPIVLTLVSCWIALPSGAVPKDSLSSVEVSPQRPPEPEELLADGVLLAEAGLPREAILLFQQVIELKPDWIAPYNNLAVVYEQQGKTEEAARVLLQGVYRQRGYQTVFENLNTLMQELKDPAPPSAQPTSLRPRLRFMGSSKATRLRGLEKPTAKAPSEVQPLTTAALVDLEPLPSY